MKLLFIGQGRMGKFSQSAAEETGDEIIEIFTRKNIEKLKEIGKVADAVIDFSSPSALPYIVDYVCRTKTPLVSGTTQYTKEEMELLYSTSNMVPMLWSANFSIGIAVFCKTLRTISDSLKPNFEIELTEALYRQKTYAPSDTSQMLLNAIDPDGKYARVYGREGTGLQRSQKEIGVHSLRGGNVASIYTTHFFGIDEEFEITHRAATPRIFVLGAINMAHRIIEKPKGIYTIDEILFGE